MVGPGFDGSPGGDRIHGRPSLADPSYHSDRDLPGMGQSSPHWQNGAGMQGKSPHSPAMSGGADRDRDPEGRRSGERNRSGQRSGRTGSGQLRICKKCGEPLTGQFVRALEGTFHLDCFRCRVGSRDAPFGAPMTGGRTNQMAVRTGLWRDCCVQVLPGR